MPYFTNYHFPFFRCTTHWSINPTSSYPSTVNERKGHRLVVVPHCHSYLFRMIRFRFETIAKLWNLTESCVMEAHNSSCITKTINVCVYMWISNTNVCILIAKYLFHANRGYTKGRNWDVTLLFTCLNELSFILRFRRWSIPYVKPLSILSIFRLVDGSENHTIDY